MVVDAKDLQPTARAIAILLANGRSDDKLKLGISNQDYAGERQKAIDHILGSAIYGVAAYRVLEAPGSLYARDVKREVDAAVATFVEAEKAKEGRNAETA